MTAITQDEIAEALSWARQYGPANCWTGTSGTGATHVMRLLRHIKHLEQQRLAPIATGLEPAQDGLVVAE